MARDRSKRKTLAFTKTKEDRKMNWEAAYRLFVCLRKEAWLGPLGSDPSGGRNFLIRQILRALCRGEAPKSILEKYTNRTGPLERIIERIYGEDLPSLTLLHEAVQAASEVTGEGGKKSILDDVYQAAFKILGDWTWHADTAWDTPDGIAAGIETNVPMVSTIGDQPRCLEPASWNGNEPLRVFRGQTRREWHLEPSIARGTEISVPEELSRLEALIDALRAEKFPDYQDIHLIAIAQHYADVANVKTWLLDVTLDPFIGLFFASCNNTGGVGALYRFSTSEIASMTGEPKSLLGTLTVVHVPAVPRLDRQRGLFLIGGHPQAVEQLVPEAILFHQTPGRVFEDPDRGITKENLLAADSEFRDTLMSWKAGAARFKLHSAKLSRLALPFRLGDLDKRDYLDWLYHKLPHLKACDNQLRRGLEHLCALHVLLQQRSAKVNIVCRSLRRLYRAAQYFAPEYAGGVPQLYHIVRNVHLPFAATIEEELAIIDAVRCVEVTPP